MNACYHLRTGDNNTILVGDKAMSLSDFQGLLRRATEHKITFTYFDGHTEVLNFTTEKTPLSGEWKIHQHGSISSMDYYFQSQILPKLQRASSALLDQKESYLGE